MGNRNVDYRVTFETKCWEGDWEYMLKTDRLSKMIANNQFDFFEKILVINNVENRKVVESFAIKAVDNGVIDKFYFVEDYCDTVLKHFCIDPEFKKDKGYKYSIAELVGLYLAQGDYLLHYSSDTMQVYKTDWLSPALDLMFKNEDVVTVSPAEDRRTSKIISKNDDRYLKTQVFSDQCYLVDLKLFKQPIYSESNEAANMYVEYGGDLFEKRVGIYLMNHGYYRIVLGNHYYYSMNFGNLLTIKSTLLTIGKDLSYVFSYIADMKRFLSRILGRS